MSRNKAKNGPVAPKIERGWPENVEKIKPLIHVLKIISITPNWPFVPSRNRLPKVIAGARAAMNLTATFGEYQRRNATLEELKKLQMSVYCKTKEQVQDGRDRFLEVLR